MIRNACVALVLVACGGNDQSPVERELPWVMVDQVSTSALGLREVSYRDVATGARYRMQGTEGAAGWLVSRPAGDATRSVRIEWTPTSVRVTATDGDGPAQFWFASRARGLDKIALDKGQDDAAGEDLPFLLRSATNGDALLASAQLATPLAVARRMTTEGSPSLPPTTAPVTLLCDNTIDISGNCGQQATLTKADKDIFSVDGGTFLDRNSMKLACGNADGHVMVQACPSDAYDCSKFANAKTESPLTVTEVTNDTSDSNWACTILRAAGEGVDVGKKFQVKGVAELRPGKPVRPKDPGDEAKSPLSCKLVWDLPEESDDLYHSQWGQEGYQNAGHTKQLEVSLGATNETGTLAIGGKTEINASVSTCQDSDAGRDDYAISVRGWRTNQLYYCHDNTPPAPRACSTNDCGVVFVHGTSDQTVESATTDYWTRDTIDKIRGGKPYLVVGYPGASNAAFDAASWGSVIDQIGAWLAANTTVTNYVVVTHSNGVNPMRYALMHPTSNTPGNRRVDSVTNKMRKMIAAGGSMKGTPLANAVTDARSLAAIANWVSTNLFNSNWNTAGVWQQRTDRMGLCTQGHTSPSPTCTGYNGDGTFGGPTDCYRDSSTCGGKPVSTVVGKSVDADPLSNEATCGGIVISTALKATQCYGFGCDGCSDGFIGCESQAYLGTKLVDLERLSHHQERRDCRGVPLSIKNEITRTSW